MWCLTLATNAIVCWSTEYHGLGVAALRRTGRDVDDEVLAHIWPTHHENVHFYGTHSVDIDGERSARHQWLPAAAAGWGCLVEQLTALQALRCAQRGRHPPGLRRGRSAGRRSGR